MPLLQLCQDCYKTTVDLLLDAPTTNQDQHEVKSTRTTPRGRWNNVVTSQSPSSCGSEGSWSVTSSLLRERTSSNLMAMYLNKLVVIYYVYSFSVVYQGF